MLIIGLLSSVAVLLLVLSALSLFRVEEGHLAVLTAFKAARRDAKGALRAYRPGLHVKRPWDVVHAVSVMEQNLELPEQSGREAMAEDGTVLKVDATLRYAPTEAGLEQYLFGIARPGPHLTALFTALMRHELANLRATDAAQLGGSYALIRRDRQRLDQRIEAVCREQLDERYGVQFHAVDLTDIHPPDELAEALNAVIAAHTHAEERFFRSEGDSHQRVLAAKEGVEIAKARAAAEEEEIVTLGAHLRTLFEQGTLPDYVSRRRAEVLSQAKATFFNEESR